MQVMPVVNSGLDTGAIAGAQRFLTVVRHQRDFTFQDVDELVLRRVPMPLTRPGTGGQCHQIDSEIGQGCRIAEAATQTARTRCVERGGIARAQNSFGRVQVDFFRHWQVSLV